MKYATPRRSAVRPRAAVLARYGLAVVLTLAGAGAASAFGTINHLKQSAEHERITRRALACASLPSDNSCFEPGTLELLAGKDKEAGAIGYPDLSTNFFKSRAHCDNGDAVGQLDLCRAWMQTYLDEAVKDADALVDANGAVKATEVKLSCVWAFNVKGKAKCNVLQDMGFVLHASQDFYSHSNWTDSKADTGIPGLGNVVPAPAISLRGLSAFPAGLISGCYSIWGACASGRPTHDDLNKDLGNIPLTGPVGAGTTKRGKNNQDFEHAVTVAVVDTQDKWAVLRERLVGKYGPERGLQMVCALTRDDPVANC